MFKHSILRANNVEQVVDVHVLPASVSGRNEEQVVDVPEPRGAPGVAHAQQLTSRAAAAWLDAPQVHSEGFFRTFHRPPKSAKGTGQSSAEMASHSKPVHVISLRSEHLGRWRRRPDSV